jgi:ABC-type transport system involved in cytochrome c biogenesis permease subunit
MRAALARSGFDPASAGQEQLMQKLKSDESFRTLLQTEFDKARTELNPAMRSWDAMLTAYSDGDASAFNAEVSTYLARLQGRFPDVLTKVNVEMLFNRVEPFYHCSVLYAAAFLLAAAGWLGWEKLLNRTALSVLAVTFVVHTGALIVRMYLQGRPPVTNLYSSAIFIGWGCVLLAMILEKLFRNGMGNVTAAVTGSLTLIVAHNLSGDGDTLEMMQAVLDTNFWLATHVTCITIGYASTFMAGFLGIMYILRGVLTTSLDEHARKAHSRMIYGIVCFATLFSFTGTVLGGIWADQSWGRFWGWDPKENGALLIVLWNALILHARWGGIVRERGMAVLAVLGNIVTAWSWFGTNMLGVGLHSYGFMTGAVFWLVVFVLTQLGISALGTLPVSLWRSFGASNPDDLRRAPLRAPATT